MLNRWSCRGLCVAALLLAAFEVGAVSAPIALRWRLVENRPENVYRAELTLRNDGTAPLGDGWTLFFNSPAKLASESVGKEYALTHINGDLFSLRPEEGYRPIAPGESRVISWQGAPWAISVSDAPSGFYLVRDDLSAAAAPQSIPLVIEPFPHGEKLMRGAADMVPVVTAAGRFRSNEALTRLPASELAQVVPTPIRTTQRVGSVTVGRTTRILYEAELAAEARLLAENLETLMGMPLPAERAAADGTSLPTSAAGGNASEIAPDASTIRLRLAEVVVDGRRRLPGAEAYTLSIAPETGIEIVGSDKAGVFYGMQTLRALAPLELYRAARPEWKLAGVWIEDAPRFRYRGLHLDVARNFQSKQTVLKLLDLMAFYKLNRFHWHLTDDEGWRVPICALPELTAVGGRRGHTLEERAHLAPSLGSGPDPNAASSAGNGHYTREDMVEILRHAQARHIAVIPELDLPGHARAAVRAMQARHDRLAELGRAEEAKEFLLTEPGDRSSYESVQMWRDNVVDVGRDATYRFVDVVVEELVAMYREAGVPLNDLHLGGDEVPAGVWEGSPACDEIARDAYPNVSRRGQLELYFLDRASRTLAQHRIRPASWEDCLVMALDGEAGEKSDRPPADSAVADRRVTAYVWNNVAGWGREDAAYRLANAGFDVVLCSATHLYFDLATEKNPAEAGYYWAGFVDARAPFEFVPLDMFKNVRRDVMGRPLAAEAAAAHTRLSPEGERHLIGIQGQLWGENLRSSQLLEYMAFPRMIALAERAWAPSPAWAQIEAASESSAQCALDWNQFANRLGQRELPRLDWFSGGVEYRLPPPGVVLRGGMIHANVAFPGLEIRYTMDGSEPHVGSPLYEAPLPPPIEFRSSQIGPRAQFRSFDSRGRGSRTVAAAPNDVTTGGETADGD